MGSSVACFFQLFHAVPREGREGASSHPHPKWKEHTGKSVTFYLFSFLEAMTIFSFPESLLLVPWQRTKREWKSTKMQGPGSLLEMRNEKLMNGHAFSGCGLELGKSQREEAEGRRRESHTYLNPMAPPSSARGGNIWVSDNFIWTDLPWHYIYPPQYPTVYREKPVTVELQSDRKVAGGGGRKIPNSQGNSQSTS